MLNWFKKLFATEKSAQEETEKPANNLENVVVGRILEIEKHPNADRLQIVRVDIGSAEPSLLTSLPEGERKSMKELLIVCGAPNIKVGQLVPVALVGAKLPGGMEIKEAEIRGVKSFGMLCAADELGLGTDHSGIMILDSPPHQCGDGDRSKKQNDYWCGGKNAKVGMEFVKYINLNK